LTLGIDDEARARIGDLPTGRGVLGELIRDARPLRVSDVGTHPSSYGFPPGHPPMRAFLGVPILIRGEAFGNLYLTEKEGGEEFDQADEDGAVILADWAAIAIDNARLYRDAEGRREELEEVVRRLRATTEMMRALEGETEIERVLELIVKRARALVGARSTVLLLVSGTELEIQAVAGDLASPPLGTRFPVEGSISGQVLKSMRAERVAHLPSRVMVSREELGLRADAALLVPLVFRARALGVLIAADRADGTEFTRDDAQLLESFAASAATAVHTARSVAEDRLRHSLDASEQERKRWARELHDDTLQALGGLQMLLSSALRSGHDERLRTAAKDAVEQVGIEIANLRSLIMELRPPALDEIGLVAAVESLAHRLTSSEGLTVETNVAHAREGSERLAPECENTIYRVLQEALTNVAKHASATHVEIGLLMEDAGVAVEVRDDGCGFDPASAGGGFGLVGMRERVALLGGRLKIDSRPGAGAFIRALIPVARGAEPDMPLTRAG
jgi:signal transduction histidine kinase